MKEAKTYFETVAKEPTFQVQARMEAFLKTQKIATSQALRFHECKIYHNGWFNRLTLRRKRSKVARKKSTFGKKILFTSLLEETTANILDYSKGAYQIENTIHLSKDRDVVPYAPAYHWTDSKIWVHGFVCILALLLIRLPHIGHYTHYWPLRFCSFHVVLTTNSFDLLFLLTGARFYLPFFIKP